MNEITDFLVRNMIAVYFFYGLAFFTMGLALAMTSRQTSRLRFARAIPYMAAFGIIHGLHEWYEMGQRIAVETQQHVVGLPEEIVRLGLLVVSFIMLLCFAVQLLVPARVPRSRIFAPVAILVLLWAVASIVFIGLQPTTALGAIAVTDGLARYLLAIPGAALAAVALMREQRSGIAAIITAMVIVRKVYRLEAYLRPEHFNNLGILLLVMACLWLYFTFAEYLTTWYGHEPTEIAVFDAKFSGPFAPYFWAMFAFCFLIPFPILAHPRTRTIAGTLVASISVNVGMWLERFTIVVPSLSNPRAPIHGFVYAPSWVEWSLMAGCFAAFSLLYMGFTKLFPIISIWELEAVHGETAPAAGAPRLAEAEA